MKIGIDLDDTICKMTEIVQFYAEKYIMKHHISISKMWEDYKMDFFNQYLPQIYREAEVKEGAQDTIRKLREQGNQIYIITARSDYYVSSIGLVLKIIEEWLLKNGIIVDGVFSNVYGIEKVKICQKEGIQWMIDDDIHNYEQFIPYPISFLLYDEKNQYKNIDERACSWKEIEKKFIQD